MNCVSGCGGHFRTLYTRIANGVSRLNQRDLVTPQTAHSPRRSRDQSLAVAYSPVVPQEGH